MSSAKMKSKYNCDILAWGVVIALKPQYSLATAVKAAAYAWVIYQVTIGQDINEICNL